MIVSPSMYAVVYYALGWVVVPEDSGQLVFSRIECRGGPEVQISRTLTVDTDLMWHVMAHGRELLVGMEVVSELPDQITSLHDLELIFKFMDGLQPCIGNDESRFKPLLEGRNGSFMDSSGARLSGMYITIIITSMQFQDHCALHITTLSATQFVL